MQTRYALQIVEEENDMKKALAIVLAVLMVLATASAFAEGMIYGIYKAGVSHECRASIISHAR